jgi:hypothetical protein
MTPVVPIVPVLVAKARRRVAADLQVQDATAPERAVAYEPTGGLIGRRTFERMRAAGAVVDAGGGRVWLDREQLDALMARVRRRVGVLGLLAAVVVGAVAIGS